MITIGICLIYYGLALWLYQLHLWLSNDRWQAFPVSRAWQAFFGTPQLGHSPLDAVGRWLLDWPLSLVLILTGLSILGTVLACRRAAEGRRHRLRRKWIAEQCAKTGYRPWNMPRVLAELDEPLPRAAKKERQIG